MFVVAPLFPWPPRDGGRIGILYRIRELHHHGIKVTLFYSHLPDENPRASPLDEWCEEVVPVARPPKGTEVWRAGTLPYGVGTRYLPALRDALRKRLARNPPDVVHLEQTQVGLFRNDVPPPIPVVLGVHNLEFRAIHARAQSIGMTPRGLVYRLEGWRMRRYETRLFSRSDWAGLVFVSREERLWVEAAHPHLRGRCSDLPPGCDPPPPPGDLANRPPNLAFVGGLWFENNAEGLLWFLRAVWPGVLQQVPDGTVTIAGRGAPRSLESTLRSTKGVLYAGEVPNVMPIYDRARGVILPIRLGAGVKVKTVEALGTGLPCIGTRHAFEGIPLDLPNTCIASDDPSTLVHGCVNALNGDADTIALGQNARRFVEAHLSWEAVGRRYVDALETAAFDRAPSDSKVERAPARNAPTARNT